MPGLIPGIVFINLNRNTNMSEKRTHSDDRRNNDRRNADRRVSDVTVEDERRRIKGRGRGEEDAKKGRSRSSSRDWVYHMGRLVTSRRVFEARGEDGAVFGCFCCCFCCW